MKILITGVCGFIGSNLAQRLLNMGEEIIGVDNFDPHYAKEFKEENLQRLTVKKNFLFYKTDIRNKVKLAEVFKDRFDCIIHLAARPGVRNSMSQKTIYEEINIGGTKNVLDLSAQKEIEKFIFASSSSVYGSAKNNRLPFSEKQKNLHPLSWYGTTKLRGEKLVADYHKETNKPAVILRFFSVYGPWGRPDMAPYIFVRSLLTGAPVTIFGNGESVRDWTYIDDIIAGIILTVRKNLSFEIINLGNSYPIKLNSLLQITEKVCGKKFIEKYSPKLSFEPDFTCANTQKASKILSWKPKTEIHEGMRKFISWYKTHRLKL